MNRLQVKKAAGSLAAVIGLGVLSTLSLQATAQDQSVDAGVAALDHSVKHIPGVAVTGVNNVLGKPFFNWGQPWGLANYPTLFVYNENGATPLPIDENTPDSAILASGISPRFLLAAGHEWKPEWINVPLRRVPVLVDFANINREVLPGMREADPLAASQEGSADPITLGQWMKAGGDLKVDCSGDGANLTLRMTNLIPNRMYSVWATMDLPSEVPTPGEIKTTSLALPVGGTPNIFVTDNSGNATYERWVKFCPLDVNSTEVPPMLTLEVMFHANHQNYGAVPSTGFVPGEWQGVIQFSHVVFPVNVQPLAN